MAKASTNIFPKIQFSEESAPATPSTGQAVVYVKSDGKLYLKDDAGTETDLTATGGGSGSAVVYPIATVPGSPDAFDEEFDTDPTSGWTWLNQSTATVSVANDMLTLYDNRNTNDISFIGVAPPSSQDWTIEALIYPSIDETTTRHIGCLAVRYSSTICGFGVYNQDEMRSLTWSSNGTGTTQSQSATHPWPGSGPIFVRAVWDDTAGTLAWEASGSGEANTWSQIHSFTPGADPDLIGFGGIFNGTQEVGYSFEYIRRTA